jgi:hypothetical protein
MASPATTGRSPVSEIFAGLQDFFTLQGKALQLKFYRSATDTLVKGSRYVALGLTGLAALVFLSAGLAFFISARTGSYATGFTVVGLIYVALTLVVLLFLNLRQENLRDHFLKQFTGNEQGYEHLVKEEAATIVALERRKQEVSHTLSELQESLRKLEERFGPLLKTEVQANGETPRGASPIVSGIAEFLISTFVLPKAGLVKRLVVPVVTKAVLGSGMLNRGKAGGLLNRLKQRFFK